MSNITLTQNQWRKLQNDIAFLKEAILPLAKNFKKSTYMLESEVIEITGLSARSLRDKRAKGEFNFSTASGRKIKYIRKEIEEYITKKSTVAIHFKKAII
jgi:predicted DNA-binding transcriptional regulator AlpA